MGLRSKSKTRLIILTVACASVVALGGGVYAYRKIERARTIAAGKPKGMEAYAKGEWVESLNHLQNYLGAHDDDLEAWETFVKVQSKLPEPMLGHHRKLLTAYRRIVAMKPGDMDAKREMLKLYLILQMNTELLSGTDEVIKSIMGDMGVKPEAVSAALAPPSGTAPAARGTAAAQAAAEQFKEALLKIKSQAADPDPVKAEAARKKHLEPLGEALEFRELSTANLRRFKEAEVASDALFLLRGDAASMSVVLNAMRASGDSKESVLAKLREMTKWDPKAPAASMPADQPVVALMAGNYLYYGENETALLLANKTATMPPPTEIDAIKLADLLDRMERPELFAKAREVIEAGLNNFKTDALQEDHFRRLVFQRQYQKAAEEIGKLDVSRRAVPQAMRVISLCEWSKELAAAGNKGDAESQRTEARKVLESLKECGLRWDTLALGWHQVLELVYFSAKPEDRKVVEICNEALMRDPGNAFFCAYQGDAYHAMGDAEAALQKWRAASARSPAWDRPLSRASRSYASSGDPWQILKWSRQANDRLPNQKDTLVAQVISWKRVVERLNPEDPVKATQAQQLSQFMKDHYAIVGTDENVLAVEVSLLKELKGAAAAAERINEIVQGTKVENSGVLLRLSALISGQLRMDIALSRLCLEKYKSLRGMTGELAMATCQMRWDETIRDLEQLQDGDPQKLLEKRKAMSSARKDDIKKLYVELRKGAADDSERLKWDVNWCRVLEYFGDPAARDEWKAMVALHGESAEALWAAMNAGTVRQDHLLTGQVLERLRVLNGDSGLQWRLAQGAWLLNDTSSRDSLEKAAKLLALTVAASPESVEARKLLSRGFELSGNLNGAINELMRATEMSPDDAETKVELGRLYMRQKDSARTGDQLTRALNLLPVPGSKEETQFHRDLRTIIGGMFAELGDAERALLALRGVDSTRVNQMRAPLLWKQGRIKEAEDAFTKMMDEKPTAEMIEQALPFFAAIGRFEKAEGPNGALAKLEGTDAAGPQKHAIKGTYWASRQEWDKAIVELNEAVKGDPKNANYWRRFIGTLLTAPGRTADGIKAAADSSGALPGDPACTAIAKMTPAQFADQDLQAYLVAAVLYQPNAKGLPEVMQILLTPDTVLPAMARRLSQVAKGNPEAVALQVFTARKLAQANLLNEAIAVMQKTSQNYPDAAEPALLATKCLAQAQRWEDALAMAQKWKVLANGSPQVDMVIAGCYVNLNRGAEAVRLLRPYFTQIPREDYEKNRDVVMLFAQALVHSGQAAEADTIIWPIVEKNRDWHEDWTKLATEHMDKRTGGAAANRWIEKLAGIVKPDDIRGQAILGLAWYRMFKDFNYRDGRSKAMTIFANVEKSNLSNTEKGTALMLFANLCEQQGDFESASTYYEAALKQDGNLIYASNNWSMVLVKLSSLSGDKKKLDLAEAQATLAIENVDKFSNLRPTDKEAVRLPFYDTLATVQSAKGNFAAAVASIDRAIKSDPENPLWYVSKAEFCVVAKREDKARDAIKSLAELGVDVNRFDPELRERYEKVVAASRLK